MRKSVSKTGLARLSRSARSARRKNTISTEIRADSGIGMEEDDILRACSAKALRQSHSLFPHAFGEVPRTEKEIVCTRPPPFCSIHHFIGGVRRAVRSRCHRRGARPTWLLPSALASQTRPCTPDKRTQGSRQEEQAPGPGSRGCRARESGRSNDTKQRTSSTRSRMPSETSYTSS